MILQNRLLIGTNNPGKLQEFRYLLNEILEVDLVSPKDIDLSLEVKETGNTYLENAELKARAFSGASGLISLADDSGLEVDALNGAPGLYSARFGGVQGSDQHDMLLSQLGELKVDERKARFRCTVVICTPDGSVFSSEGVCEGWIGYEPKGEKGFGYDPLFVLPEYNLTMAEIDLGVKNKISHRARAIAAANEHLKMLYK